MSIKIEFIKNHEEYTVPLIKLTKSKNGKTGTATFIFIEPDVFKLIDNILPYLMRRVMARLVFNTYMIFFFSI
jgi:hypothetical protein